MGYAQGRMIVVVFLIVLVISAVVYVQLHTGPSREPDPILTHQLPTI